jgi:hypothetical protein
MKFQNCIPLSILNQKHAKMRNAAPVFDDERGVCSISTDRVG